LSARHLIYLDRLNTNPLGIRDDDCLALVGYVIALRVESPMTAA
jgi:hypothetical protein